MAQEMQRCQPSTTLSLEQRVAKSKIVLQCATSPRDALEAGKKLIGQWPHSKPPEPETYAAAIAAVLGQYPLGLVQECVDPRSGLAREREFPPTVAAVVEWCNKRLAWHQSLAAYVPTRKTLPERQFTPGECVTGAAAIRGLQRALVQRLDIADLTYEQAVELGSE